MKCVLLLLVLAASASAGAQQRDVRADRKSAEHAQNRRNCENALRVVSVCGSRAAAFSCDDDGFHREPSASAPAGDNAQVFAVEQCARWMTGVGP